MIVFNVVTVIRLALVFVIPFSNAPTPTLVHGLLQTSIQVRVSMLENEYCPNYSNDRGNLTSVKPVPTNASIPINSTFEISIEIKD